MLKLAMRDAVTVAVDVLLLGVGSASAMTVLVPTWLLPMTLATLDNTAEAVGVAKVLTLATKVSVCVVPPRSVGITQLLVPVK